jgi:hypothetical protein
MKGTASDEIMKSFLRGCWYVPQAKSNHSTTAPPTTDIRRTFVVHIKLFQIRATGSWWIQGRHGSPAGCTRHFRCRESGQTSNRGNPWARWFLPMLTLRLVSASWESVGRRDPTARLEGRAGPMPARLPKCTKYIRFCQECPQTKGLGFM